MRLSIRRADEPTTSTVVERDSGSSKRASVQEDEVELPPPAESDGGPKIWECSRSRSGISTLPRWLSAFVAEDLRRSRRLRAVSRRSRADNLGAAEAEAEEASRDAAGRDEVLVAEWTDVYAETREEGSKAAETAAVASSNEFRRRVRTRRRWSGPVLEATELSSEEQLPEDDAACAPRRRAAGPIMSSLQRPEEASISRAMFWKSKSANQ